jgi:hypothetical protein
LCLVSRLRIKNCYDNLVIDQTEVSTFESLTIETPTRACIWIVNGADVTAGVESGFTNMITIRDCQINLGAWGIADDGGYGHYVSGCNFNGQSVGWGRFAGVTLTRVSVCDCESRGLHLVNTTLGLGTSQPAPYSIEFDKCSLIEQVVITACQQATFRDCQFASGVSQPAILGGGNATELNFERCIDINEGAGGGFIDNFPTYGHMGDKAGATGGPDQCLVFASYNIPTISARLGSICWNKAISATPISASMTSWTVVGKVYTGTGGSGNLFLDGLAIGMKVTMAGFSNAGNNGVKTILVLGPTTITIAESGGVNEGPSSPTSITYNPVGYIGWACQGGSTWRAFGALS